MHYCIHLFQGGSLVIHYLHTWKLSTVMCTYWHKGEGTEKVCYPFFSSFWKYFKIDLIFLPTLEAHSKVTANKRHTRFLRLHTDLYWTPLPINILVHLMQYNLRKHISYFPITTVAVVKLVFSKTSVFVIIGEYGDTRWAVFWFWRNKFFQNVSQIPFLMHSNAFLMMFHFLKWYFIYEINF